MPKTILPKNLAAGRKVNALASDAKGQHRTYAPQHKHVHSITLVGERHQHRRHVEAKRLAAVRRDVQFSRTDTPHEQANPVASIGSTTEPCSVAQRGALPFSETLSWGGQFTLVF
jgi:hypothetical protein